MLEHTVCVFGAKPNLSVDFLTSMKSNLLRNKTSFQRIFRKDRTKGSVPC